MSKKKRLAKMVIRIVKREAKAHRLLAESIGREQGPWNDTYETWREDWLTRVRAFLKDGVVDDDVLS
jgi:hypothetical protein